MIDKPKYQSKNDGKICLYCDKFKRFDKPICKITNERKGEYEYCDKWIKKD